MHINICANYDFRTDTHKYSVFQSRPWSKVVFIDKIISFCPSFNRSICFPFEYKLIHSSFAYIFLCVRVFVCVCLCVCVSVVLRWERGWLRLYFLWICATLCVLGICVAEYYMYVYVGWVWSVYESIYIYVCMCMVCVCLWCVWMSLILSLLNSYYISHSCAPAVLCFVFRSHNPRNFPFTTCGVCVVSLLLSMSFSMFSIILLIIIMCKIDHSARAHCSLERCLLIIISRYMSLFVCTASFVCDNRPQLTAVHGVSKLIFSLMFFF